MAVIFVEDDQFLYGSLMGIGDSFGYSTMVFQDPYDYLEYLSDNPVETLVTDLYMPINGIEILRRTREKHPDANLYLLTGHRIKQELQAEITGLGATYHLKGDNLVDFLQSLSSSSHELGHLEEREVDERVVFQERHERALDLIRTVATGLLDDLQAMKDSSSESWMVFGGEQTRQITASDIFEDICNLTPEGKEYVAAWLDLVRSNSAFNDSAQTNSLGAS